ncbi:hypothetical protein MUN89_02605 [Halobacillus salinarum]|uniref:Uncharacterized protein n=1 Tax=Halobacillus salinarum TaxID=2932257 RepID=A0ABY4EMI1_9BACI|nr:hypothetical protein [Halobacillus salinarum]UOQ44864.1 hypothetical protein MUN89_02605 [Halobacillus salinarum]
MKKAMTVLLVFVLLGGLTGYLVTKSEPLLPGNYSKIELVKNEKVVKAITEEQEIKRIVKEINRSNREIKEDIGLPEPIGELKFYSEKGVLSLSYFPGGAVTVDQYLIESRLDL